MVGCHLGDDLRRNVACGGEALGLFNKSSADDGTVFQHVFKVDKVAVVHMLGEVVGVMEVDDALVVCPHNILGEQHSACNVLRHLACHVVTLNRVDGGIFIGILCLNFFVGALDQRHDAIIGGVCTAHQLVGVTVCDIGFGKGECPLGHDFFLHQILYVLHTRCARKRCADVGDLLGYTANHLVADAVHRLYGHVCLVYCVKNLLGLEGCFCSVSLDNFHTASPFLYVN